jgi:hypothetical protein
LPPGPDKSITAEGSRRNWSNVSAQPLPVPAKCSTPW